MQTQSNEFLVNHRGTFCRCLFWHLQHRDQNHGLCFLYHLCSVWAWNIIYLNELPALGHKFALIVSTLPLRSTSCWHPVPITHSTHESSGFTLHFWPHPEFLFSLRWDHHPKFWAGSNLSLVLAVIIYAQAGTLLSLSHLHYDFSAGLPFSESEHDSGLNQSLHRDNAHVIYTLLCFRVSFPFKQFALLQV